MKNNSSKVRQFRNCHKRFTVTRLTTTLFIRCIEIGIMIQFVIFFFFGQDFETNRLTIRTVGPKLVTVVWRSSIVSPESWQESFSQTYISSVTCDRNNVIRSSASSLSANRPTTGGLLCPRFFYFFIFFFETFQLVLWRDLIFLAILLTLLLLAHVVCNASASLG